MKKSFTLIELIVVIAILGILAAIIVPNISNVTGTAKVAQVQADLKTTQTGVDMYALDYFGNVPVKDGVAQPQLGSPQAVDFDKLVPNYLRSQPNKNVLYWVDAYDQVQISTVDAPTGLTSDGTSIHWNPVDGVDQYNIYKITNLATGGKVLNVSVKKINDTTETTFSTEDGVLYGVSSVDKLGLETPMVTVLSKTGETNEYQGHPNADEVVPNNIQGTVKPGNSGNTGNNGNGGNTGGNGNTVTPPPTYTSGDLNYTKNEDNSVVVSDYTGDQTEVTIPDTIEGNPVKEIGEEAYRNNDLTSVTIPQGVEKIGDSAFAQNPLEYVIVENPNTVFGNDVFSNISPNFAIVGHTGSTAEAYAASHGYSFIGFEYFAYTNKGNGTAAITSYNDPNKSTDLNMVVPAKINGLTIDEISSGGMRTTINGKTNTYKSAIFPNTVKTFGNNLSLKFGNNYGKLVIPSGAESITDSAFSNSGIDELDFSKATNLKSIQSNAFTQNELTSLVLPESLSVLQSAASNGEIFSKNKIKNITILNRNLTIAYTDMPLNNINHGMWKDKDGNDWYPESAGWRLNDYTNGPLYPNNEIDAIARGFSFSAFQRYGHPFANQTIVGPIIIHGYSDSNTPAHVKRMKEMGIDVVFEPLD